VCGVWCVVCGVWRVACGVWRVACGVWRDVVWCVVVWCVVWCVGQRVLPETIFLCDRAPLD
jgi:hypothetical protein